MFTLDEVVPWGRSFDEYRRMFAVSDDELRLRILGCGDGPASFNAEATQRSPYIDQNVDELRESGFDVSIENVEYEFQRGGNQMMRIRRPATRASSSPKRRR